LALSSVSQLAHANTEQEPPPPSAEVQIERPAQTEPPANTRLPRVIWAAPGEAPARPPPVVEPAPRARGFRVANVRFLIGLERASSVAYYRSTADVDGSDYVTRGVEASIIGSVDDEPYTPLVLPRLGLDTRLSSDLTLGLSFSYAAHSAKLRGGDSDQALPASESIVLGPRVGYFRPVSKRVAVWLRGGLTWAGRTSTAPSDDYEYLERRWAFTLEPQLVFMPLRHVGLSFGGAFDLGFDGKTEVSYQSASGFQRSRDVETASTYGVSAGLLALF
jgi:hypothetical protein